MKRKAKIFCVLQCLLCIAAGSVWADDVIFKATAPSQVIVGKPFQLTYSVNQRSKDLRAPEMPDFDVLAGPYQSTSSSTSFVNGKRTSSFSQTYTYTLMAQRTGTFTVAPASIAAKKKTSGLGFNAVKVTSNAYEEELTLQNLIDFGMIPELAGRINEIINLHPITLDGYKAAIKNQSASPIRQIEESFLT